MKTTRRTLLASSTALAACSLFPHVAPGAESGWAFSEQADQSLSLGGAKGELWTHIHRVAEGKPYFHPLRTIDGHNLTWLRPADHKWHRALWFSWKLINGLNYWEEEKDGHSQGRTEIAKVSAQKREDRSAVVAMDLDYRPPGKDVVLAEKRILTMLPPQADGSYRIDWHQMFVARQEAVLDRTKIPREGGPAHGGYAGLSYRCAQKLKNRKLLDSSGWSTEKAVTGRGQGAKWMDLSGTVDDAGKVSAGVTMFDHPSNPRHPTPWWVGLPMGYLGTALIFDEPLKLKKDEQLALRYRVLVHSAMGDAKTLDGEFASFAASKA